MQPDDDKPRGSVATRVLLALAAVAVAGMLLWASDQVTLQGERTIYTVDCAGGTWNGATCSGRLVPGKRYAFRASKTRHEVLYWIRGSEAPSGKYSDCTVANRDNWSCNVTTAPAAPTIAFDMVKGQPTRVGSGLVLPYHSVPKWKWWLMDAGFGGFTQAQE